MNSFRYQAVHGNGSQVTGVIEAEDRRAALLLLGEKGLFPSILESALAPAVKDSPAQPTTTPAAGRGFRLTKAVSRKEVTSFTREMGALLSSGIPIPQAQIGRAHV